MIALLIGIIIGKTCIKKQSIKIVCEENPNELGIISWCRPIIYERQASEEFPNGSYLINNGEDIRETGKEQVKKYYLLPIKK